MDADTAPKVGFRPYLQTDAFGAAHLSGTPSGQRQMGAYFYNRPFDPWELHATNEPGLHGIGASNPFHESAWQLHGLGQASDAVVSAAVDELQSAGTITTAEAQAILEGSMTFQDVLGYDPTDQASWANILGQFQQTNQALQALEQAVGADPNVARAIGAQLVQQRTQYSDLAAQFTQYYTLVMGTPPSGLSGLGFLPIIYVAGAVVFLVSAVIAIYAIHTWASSVNVNTIKAQAGSTTATSTAATNQQLLTALSAAQAKGDTITAQAILKTLQTTGAQPAAPSTLETWLMSNAGWLALGAAGLIAIGPISQGLFGGRRR
jgi:hypothetical protein